MLKRLPAPLTGAIVGLLFALNTLLWAIPAYLAILLKLFTREDSAARDRVSRWVAAGARRWAASNITLGDACLPVAWEIRVDATVRPDGQYLVCCNHQSWNDIYVLIKTFGRGAPFFKFFLKQELIWVPVLGLVWWGLDYPFMRRYTAEQAGLNPALRGKDLETTRRACARFRNQPALILNFLEGTRFTPAKHARQRSPYRHLLKPKSGGFAFAVTALGDRLHSLLDVTIVYPDGARGFWDFLAGRVRRVVVEVRQIEIPPEFLAEGYDSDPAFRRRFQDWIARIWSEKDRRIGELLIQHGAGKATIAV